MVRQSVFRTVLLGVGIWLLSNSILWAAEGVISKVADSSGSACHLKFPAIREETLSWARPVLKDPRDGDIIDFYGPCDHDPLGKAEVFRQKGEYEQRKRRVPEGD